MLLQDEVESEMMDEKPDVVLLLKDDYSVDNRTR